MYLTSVEHLSYAKCYCKSLSHLIPEIDTIIATIYRFVESFSKLCAVNKPASSKAGNAGSWAPGTALSTRTQCHLLFKGLSVFPK